MPELPEVEVLRRQLFVTIVGKKFARVVIRVPKLCRPLMPSQLQKLLRNQKVTDVMRRAKLLIFKLSGGNFLVVHLKMTGQLIYQPQRGMLVVGGHPQQNGTLNLPNSYTHAIFSFTDRSTLFFNDLRKFGWIRLVDNDQMARLISRIGVDPLSATFTLPNFGMLLLCYPNRNIKHALMDQKIFAGIGNIYADESCFRAGVLPSRKISALKVSEIEKLHHWIPRILKLSIGKHGTSVDRYVHLDGSRGGFFPYLKVYGRSGLPCKMCGHPIRKMQLNQRGTHYCPRCQK